MATPRTTQHQNLRVVASQNTRIEACCYLYRQLRLFQLEAKAESGTPHYSRALNTEGDSFTGWQ